MIACAFVAVAIAMLMGIFVHLHALIPPRPALHFGVNGIPGSALNGWTWGQAEADDCKLTIEYMKAMGYTE